MCFIISAVNNLQVREEATTWTIAAPLFTHFTVHVSGLNSLPVVFATMCDLHPFSSSGFNDLTSFRSLVWCTHDGEGSDLACGFTL